MSGPGDDPSAASEAGADEHEPFLKAAALLVVAIVVLPALGLTASALPRPRAVELAALGSLYFVMATGGVALCERRWRGGLVPVMAAMTLLALAMLWVGELPSSLMVMPQISMVVIFAGLGWAIGFTALLVLFGAFVGYHGGAPLGEALGNASGFVPAAAFVIAFSELMVHERRARNQVRRYAAQVEQLAVTNERNRIAREIHDSVGHYLTVVNVQIEAGRALVGRDGRRADECLERAQELAREGLSELRRSVAMLRDVSVDERPFGAAIAGLFDDARGRGLDARFVVEGSARPLGPAIEFALYRVTQEALTNVARHARARRVDCVLRYDDGGVALHVADDGVGADGTGGGYGLTGARERVQLLGGELTVRTEPGRGFAIDVTVPT